MDDMSDFHYRRGQLYCEAVPLSAIAEAVGTPCYIYSHGLLKHHFLGYQHAFSAVPHLTAFAMKANSNLAILRLFSNLGGGADIVSEGELHRAQTAGIAPERIVFAGVGKTRGEMAAALRAGILMFNIESAQEMTTLDDVARDVGIQAPVALRVNPDINPRTHPYISTGLKQSKFGIEIAQAVVQYKLAARLRHIRVVGIHSHIGSQLTSIRPFVDALKRVSALIAKLRAEGLSIEQWDIGGGLGIPYGVEAPPQPAELAAAILPLLQKSGCRIILEPGRSLVGNAGILLTRVLYTKEGEAKNFVIADAGMNDLIRPSLYEAHHEILPVTKRRRAVRTVDVVGPICESGDFLAQDRAMPEARAGELLAVMSAGAYGFSMASNYNARPRPPEILVNGATFDIVRRRETLDDLLRGEQIPAYLT